MSSLTESTVLDQLGEAFDSASLDLKSRLDREMCLEEIDGIDSVSRVRLMLSVEEVFGIEISPKENSGLQTIGDLVDLVLAKRAKPGRPG
jgi:acyl carrier protein